MLFICRDLADRCLMAYCFNGLFLNRVEIVFFLVAVRPDDNRIVGIDRKVV